MNGNIKKIREKHATDPAACQSLQNIVRLEMKAGGGGKKTATEGLLWLTRGLDFTSQALRRNIANDKEELNVSFSKAYENTLQKYHSFLVRPVFSLAMKACPYRQDFYKKVDTAGTEQ